MDAMVGTIVGFTVLVIVGDIVGLTDSAGEGAIVGKAVTGF